MMARPVLALLLVGWLFLAPPFAAAAEQSPWGGVRFDLGRHQRMRFQVEGATVHVDLPRDPAPGRPWVWHLGPLTDPHGFNLLLLEHGFHVVHVDPRALRTNREAVVPALINLLVSDQQLAADLCLWVSEGCQDLAATLQKESVLPVRWVEQDDSQADDLDRLTNLRFALQAAGRLPQWGWVRGGLPRSRARMEGGKRLRIAFLGGSITHNPGWKEQVAEQLAADHPKSRVEVIAAGIPSVDSTGHAFRLHREVLSHGPIDLLVVEAAVNDATNGRSAVEQRRAMEGIVRAAREANPSTEVLFVYFAMPTFLEQQAAGHCPAVIRAHETVADYYRLPSLDLSREVGDRIAAGEFEWQRDFVDLHPSPFGQQLYARGVLRFLADCWAASGPPSAEPEALPPPLDPFAYDRGVLLPVTEEAMAVGWWIDESWHPTDGVPTRPGFVDVPMLVTDEAEAPVLLHFEGRAVGIWDVAGPDIGILEYSIDFGPYRRLDLRTPWSQHLHLPWMHMLATELAPGNHRVEMRLAPGVENEGRWLRIAWFVVNG